MIVAKSCLWHIYIYAYLYNIIVDIHDIQLKIAIYMNKKIGELTWVQDSNNLCSFVL